MTITRNLESVPAAFTVIPLLHTGHIWALQRWCHDKALCKFTLGPTLLYFTYFIQIHKPWQFAMSDNSSQYLPSFSILFTAH